MSDVRWDSQGTERLMSIELRDYQQEFVDNIRAAYAEGHRSVMGVAPTGFGKTISFDYMADGAAELGNLTYITVPRRELIKQTSKSLIKSGINHGIIAAGFPEKDCLIQLCSEQTLIRRLERYRPPDFWIKDEGHHLVSKSCETIYDWCSQAAVLAVTATPIRSDGRGFDKYCSKMICGADIGTLVELGWLSRPVMYAPPIPEIDLSDVHMLAGDYNKKELGIAMDKQVITGSAVAHYKKLLPHLPPTVAFCVSIAHARHVANEFIANGIPAESIDGEMEDEEREAIIRRVATGETKVLTSCDLISEGFDLSAAAGCDVAIACAIMLRPTKSLAVYLQQAGRALRPSKYKTETLILDHVNNWQMHGLVDEPREWSLEGRKKRTKASKGIALATCEKCYAVFPPVPVCPACGNNMKVAGNKGREIEEQDGELVQLDKETVLSFRATTMTSKGGFAKKTQVIKKLERA